MEIVIALKSAAVAFAVIGAHWRCTLFRRQWRRRKILTARKRRWYIASYASTSVSMLLLAATAFF